MSIDREQQDALERDRDQAKDPEFPVWMQDHYDWRSHQEEALEEQQEQVKESVIPSDMEEVDWRFALALIMLITSLTCLGILFWVKTTDKIKQHERIQERHLQSDCEGNK